MSQIISLVKYDYRNEKLYENNSVTIEQAFLGENFTSIINNSIATTKIYEDSNSDDFSEIDCIGDIEKNIKLYEDRFDELIKNEKNENNENNYSSIELFRTLTNIHHIFWLKKEKFKNKDNVIVKLG